MTRRLLSRRAFCSALLPGVVLAGCRTDSPPDPAPQSGTSAGCTDPAALSDDVRRARTALGYADETSVAGQRCDNCQFWLAPEGDVPCGGCVVLIGPVRPAGTCNSWAPQA